MDKGQLLPMVDAVECNLGGKPESPRPIPLRLLRRPIWWRWIAQERCLCRHRAS